MEDPWIRVDDPFAETVDLATSDNGQNPEDPDRVFVDAYDFVAERVTDPVPLWGSDECTIIAAGGLTVLAGRPGSGKTTWILDLACHLAAGLSYPPPSDECKLPPWPVPRPLRIALIENEGPQEMFRSKLEQKLEFFPHDLRDGEGSLMIQSWRWGSFSFADYDANEKAQAELDQHRIDLVIGDPLASLGPAGVGSPADTRDFVACLRPLGLGTVRAFMFLHHFRERTERNEDELARISGAWGGHLDTLLTLSSTRDGNQARLAYPKLRWARIKTPSPLILGRLWNTASFEGIAEEGDATVLEPGVSEELAKSRAEKRGRKGEGWMTYAEIGRAINRRPSDVKKALEGAPHLFMVVTGEGAKSLGAKSNAMLWGLVEWGAQAEPAARGLDEPGQLTWSETQDATLALQKRDGTYNHTLTEVITEAERRRRENV